MRKFEGDDAGGPTSVEAEAEKVPIGEDIHS